MKYIIHISIIVFIVACSTKSKIKYFPLSANAKEEITNLSAAIENSKKRDVDLLAPLSFKDAQESIKESQEKLYKNKSNESVLKVIAEGRSYLDQAEKNAIENRLKLQDILAARDAAILAKAPSLMPESLKKWDAKLKEHAGYLEKGKNKNLRENRSALITGYYDLQLMAIKQDYLGDSRSIIDNAIKNGARDLTPKTLSEANKSYLKAEEFITKDRNDLINIKSHSANALKDAKKLENTLYTARTLTSTTPEDTALRMQREKSQFRQAKEELVAEKQTSAALAETNTELVLENRLDDIYKKARAAFAPNEAEIYKEGEKIVIRLRALKFPQSQAVLKGNDFVLLKKVEEVIDSLRKSSVKVEGHTDSTGGKKLNKRLSEARAEAVRKYLEANVESIAEIESEGYGYDRPLASNKTKEGRAQNRRVDIVIEPDNI